MTNLGNDVVGFSGVNDAGSFEPASFDPEIADVLVGGVGGQEHMEFSLQLDHRRALHREDQIFRVRALSSESLPSIVRAHDLRTINTARRINVKDFDSRVPRKNGNTKRRAKQYACPSNLLGQGHERIPGGIDQDAAVVDAEEAPFDLEQDVVVGIGDDEAAVRQGHHFPHDRDVHHLRNAVLGSEDRRRLRHHHPNPCMRVDMRDRERCSEEIGRAHV